MIYVTIRKSAIVADKWVAYAEKPIYGHINSDGEFLEPGKRYCHHDSEVDACAARDLYLKKHNPLNQELEETNIRKFGNGATRDTIEGKLSYVKGLSPIVLQRYLQYLDKHRLQSDGLMREFNNWKRGIPVDTYNDSLFRHAMAAWLLHDGFPVKDNHGSVTLEDTLCAIIFNASGWLHESLKSDFPQYTVTVANETKPGYGGDCKS